MDKPSGVTVFGVLETIFSGLAILGTLFSLILVPIIAAVTPGLPSTAYLIISGLIGLALAVVGLVEGIGLLASKKWARKLAIVLACITILVAIINLVVNIALALGIAAAIAGFVIGVAYRILILWYFHRPNVVKYFAGLK